jgi:hypothetical protein
VDLVLILLACHLIGAPFEASEHVTFRTVRLTVPEHVEPFDVPVLYGFLNSFFELSTFGGKFGARIGAEVDVAFCVSNNVRIFDYTGKWKIRAANKLFQLKATDAVNEKPNG